MARAGFLALAATAAVLAAEPAAARDFYEGKTIALLAGAPAGSEHDKLARLVAKHLQAQIPGKPAINVDNRSANAGVDALNAFAADAPKDGTALHLVMPGMTFLQAVRAPSARFDTGALNYLGNLSKAPHALVTWWVTGFKTIDDGRRREMNLGAVGNVGPGAYYPPILDAMLRTRFKVIGNYRRDQDVDEGMENSEVGGRVVSWATLKVNQPGWIAQKRLGILVQIGLAKHPDLPDAPLLTSLAASDRDRALLAFVSSDAEHARAIAAPRGTPPEQVSILRTAFDAMTADPAFVAEARAGRFDLSPANGEETAKAVESELRTPRDVVDRVRAILSDDLR